MSAPLASVAALLEHVGGRLARRGPTLADEAAAVLRASRVLREACQQGRVALCPCGAELPDYPGMGRPRRWCHGCRKPRVHKSAKVRCEDRLSA